MHSIYIHIPFCKTRCKYCDFFSTTLLECRREYVDALIREWQMRRVSDIRTIYFGGGTPSLLEVEDIRKILTAICPDLNAKSGNNAIEVTLEANPGDLTLEKLKELRQIGVNRLSIGVQTFRPPLLRLIGRRHTAMQARRSIRWAQKAGFDNISIDLMYGLPGQTMLQWAMDVRKAVRTGVQHISCYCLSIEEGTPFYQMMEAGEIKPTSERRQNRMYHLLCRVLKRNGFEHYEVSNFALRGFRSQHNSSYWTDRPYIGLGAGAHSYDGQVRSWNPSDLQAYISGISSNSLKREEEELTDEQKHIERVMLQLRTIEGLDINEVSNKLTIVDKYIQNGCLQQSGQRIIATPTGLNILNQIIKDLI